MKETKQKIIFVDDAEEQIPTLIDILKNGFEVYKSKVDKPELELPEIDKIFISDWIDETKVNENFSKYLEPKKPLTDYYLIDICLTNRESNLSAEEITLTETSGYKLAELIKSSAGFTGKISIISRILSAAKGSNVEGNKFGTIIKKPLDASGSPITMPSFGNQYTYDLPRVLYTHDTLQAFCNLIFHNYFNSAEE